MKTLLPLLLLFSGCSVLQPVEDTSVHYLLNPAVANRSVGGTSPTVAIADPALPGYLDRQQLVSRSAEGVIQMNTSQLWGEPLDAGIARVTALNLGRLTNSLNIQPAKSFITLDYQWLLEIRVSRFEPDAAGNLVFECTWKLQPVAGPVARTRRFATTVPIAGDAVPTGPQTARIAAMDEALARLAREIAKSL